jgi:hypothetical protein
MLPQQAEELVLRFLYFNTIFCSRPDVWFVTITQALVWMTDPRPAKNLNTFDAWNCAKRQNIPPPPCNLPNSCALTFKPPEANVSSTR